MSKACDFVKECGVFYVLSMNNGQPAGRPFGAIMEYNDKLYFSTATVKDVYKQLTVNPAIQILAFKPETREWIRMNGKAVECKDLAVKQQMFEECPVLARNFEFPESEYFAVFEVADKEALLNTNGEFVKIDAEII